MAKIYSKCYSSLYIRYGMSIKGTTNHETSFQSIFFHFKTVYIQIKTIHKDESACL